MPTLLRQLLVQRNWQNYATFRARFESAARELARSQEAPHLAALSFSPATYERWCSGQVTPVPDARLVLTHIFGYSMEELMGQVTEAKAGPVAARSGREPEQAVPAVSAQFTSLRTNHGADVHEMGRQAAMAAQRALRFAVAAETGQLGQETMTHLGEEVRRIARAYPSVPLTAILNDLIETQDLTFRLLESARMKPGQARELHLVAALTSGMLAKASHDLGDPDSAMRQARAAYICADQADHHAMRAWVRGLQSLIAYWAGRAGDAVNYASNGATSSQRGTGTVSTWLASLEGRAHALLGDTESVRAAHDSAERAENRTELDELDEIGGIFTFPRPRHLYYAAEADVLSPEPSPSVEAHAEEAVAAYKSAPPEQWAFGDEAGAQTNLAMARIAAGNLDGAAEAVRPVLELPPDQHNNGIIISAQRVHRALCQSTLRSAAPAKELRAQIEAFASTPVRALPR